jgi:mRNA-degrading endonuclease YafQ of YafQ-DinJ toxin-antitoxin module
MSKPHHLQAVSDKNSHLLVANEYFKKKVKKLLKADIQIKPTFQKVIEILEKNPFSPSLKTHKVISKNYGEAYSTRLTGDLRIIWQFGDKNDEVRILNLLDVGGHSGTNKVY